MIDPSTTRREPARHYLRFPHLHDQSLTFVAEDDVWLVTLDAPLNEGAAQRISSAQRPAHNPRFSPDGTRLAWDVVVDGAPEVVTVAVEGGEAHQRTWWGHPKTRVRGWLNRDEVLAVTSALEAESRAVWAHAVPVDAGVPRRLPYGPVESVAPHGDGTIVLGTVLSREQAWWKRYRGGTAGTLWISPRGGGEEFDRLVPEIDGNLCDPMWVGDRIAFLSDHEGHGNIYSVTPEGADLRRHTDHEGFYARHAASDATRIVYERAGQLWLLENLDTPARPLDVQLTTSRTTRRPTIIDAKRQLRDVAPDRTGRASAVEVHGTVHWLTHRDGPVRSASTDSGIRARLPRPVGDEHLVHVDDADFDEALVLTRLDGSAQPERIPLPEHGRATQIAPSPDGRWLGVSTEDGTLRLLEVGTGRWRHVTHGQNGPSEELTFSPDSAWLAWSEPVAAEGARHKIRLAAVADAEPVDVTDGRFQERSPSFAPDGTFLAFLSARSFDPVYDTHRFDLGFPASWRPFLVTLQADTPSPFGPTVRGAGVATTEPATPESSSPSTPPSVSVDLDTLGERIIPVPVAQGSYSHLVAAQGALIWQSAPVDGVMGDGRANLNDPPAKPVLQRFDLSTRQVETLAEGIDGAWPSDDRARLVVRDDDGLRVVPSATKVEPDSGHAVSVDLGRLAVRLDPGAFWRQAFDEDWRLLRDFFWIQDMSGVDWSAVRDQYRPLVDALGSHDDLVDLLWDMHGELGTSHAYVIPPTGPDGEPRQGKLGADLRRSAAGWQVERVLPGESSDPRARSPLSAPGVHIRPGDLITAVNGISVGADGVGPLLAGLAGKPVELSVARDGQDQNRRVAVVPLADEERLRYQDLVAARRATVRAASNGRFGYLHIPDMIAHGWSQLHRDLAVETERDALVVDVRANRGGHTSELVAELLGRTVLGWDTSRDQPQATYPSNAPRGPIVVLADEWSGSDGDMITAVMQLRGIGPVVGKRTWGGVIGIDQRFDLADGTVVTQPRYALWFHGPRGEELGWTVENYGVEPDIEVPFPPQAHGRGADPQLDRALQVLEDLLAERPTARPPTTTDRPDRSAPPLPPR